MADIVVSNISIRPRVRLGVRPQLVSTERDGRNLLLTVIVRCVDNTCGMTPEWNKTRTDQLLFVVTIF